MADVIISNLPTYTASTVTGTYFIINNSGNTTTFKATREQFVPMGFGTGTCSTVGGAASNTASGNCSAALAGASNSASGNFSFAGGGQSNTISGIYSTIVGGQNNTACFFCSFIGGGGSNGACGNGAFVGAGDSNKACGGNTVIVGGSRNTVSSSYAAIVAGRSGTASGNRAFIGNGFYNTASGCYSIVVNGNSNTASGAHSVIGGGFSNTVSGAYSAVLGGGSNCINGCNNSIAGGSNNFITGSGTTSSIVGGCYNCMSVSSSSFIGGGGAYFCGNNISVSNCSVIGGGFRNSIIGNCGDATAMGYNVINGGGCHYMCYNIGSVIGGGLVNSIVSCYNVPNFNVIGGGVGNNTCGGCWTYQCCFCNLYLPYCPPLSNACYTFIGGGWQNMNNHMYGVIGGGSCNILACCSYTYPVGSVIAGGIGNGTTGGSWGAFNVNGGWSCCPSACNLGCFSSIGGGFQNNTTGCYGTIPGGRNNTVSGNYSGAVGCFITATANCTFYVNNLCVCGTLSKVSGSFKIPHPDPSKTNKFLQHSFVEAPTAGENIYRYSMKTTNCSAFVELPEYYKFLNENDQVFVTPKNHFGSAYGIVNQEQTCVSFCSNCDGEYNVLVIGTRKDKEAMNYWKGTDVEEVQQ
jgi:hypothetical protein